MLSLNQGKIKKGEDQSLRSHFSIADLRTLQTWGLEALGEGNDMLPPEEGLIHMPLWTPWGHKY